MNRKIIKQSTRSRVVDKCDRRCSYCGKELEIKTFQVDHYYPINSEAYYKAIGINVHDYRNLMPSCRSCNHYKRADKPEDFKIKMMSIHERIIKNYINKVGIDFGVIKITPFDGLFYWEKYISGMTAPKIYSYPEIIIHGH